MPYTHQWALWFGDMKWIIYKPFLSSHTWFLHIGQLPCRVNHSSMQYRWKRWPQLGSLLTESSSSKSCKYQHRPLSLYSNNQFFYVDCPRLQFFFFFFFLKNRKLQIDSIIVWFLYVIMLMLQNYWSNGYSRTPTYYSPRARKISDTLYMITCVKFVFEALFRFFLFFNFWQIKTAYLRVSFKLNSNNFKIKPESLRLIQIESYIFC